MGWILSGILINLVSMHEDYGSLFVVYLLNGNYKLEKPPIVTGISIVIALDHSRLAGLCYIPCGSCLYNIAQWEYQLL